MDIVCYSHLRWNFVYQRPQHLLARFARNSRVFYIEEPVFGSDKARLDSVHNEDNVWIIVAHLPHGLTTEDIIAAQNYLLKGFFDPFEIRQFIAWYYTPMALGINPSFQPSLVVYDCMDELSAFKNAPLVLAERENELMRQADIVFTGGNSLYLAKKHKHLNIFCFPSSIDRKHFEKARHLYGDLPDQQNIPFPRIGFFGVIDERMDIGLLAEMAEKKPDWHFILIGPVVKINPADLPRQLNIHYLGSKTYKELPNYIAKWDVAMMPFAINESTRYISPTKTPEYLAAGKPVVSTPVIDVVTAYGETGLVYIAATANQFIIEIQNALDMPDRFNWQKAVDIALSQQSWDKTVGKMMFQVNLALENLNEKKSQQKKEVYV